MKLTPRQVEVLRDLNACDKYGGGILVTLPDGHEARMYTPFYFGGMNGTHHSSTATTLAKKGLVDRYKYAYLQMNKFNSRAKGACVYKITEAGRNALRQLKTNTAD